MTKMTHEEYTEWCLSEGLHAPELCECGNCYHYVCATCNPSFFGRERLNPEDQLTGNSGQLIFDSPNSENK